MPKGPSRVVHAFNPRIQESESGESQLHTTRLFPLAHTASVSLKMAGHEDLGKRP